MFTVKVCAHCGHEWINGGHCPMCGGPRKGDEGNDLDIRELGDVCNRADDDSDRGECNCKGDSD